MKQKAAGPNLKRGASPASAQAPGQSLPSKVVPDAAGPDLSSLPTKEVASGKNGSGGKKAPWDKHPAEWELPWLKQPIPPHDSSEEPEWIRTSLEEWKRSATGWAATIAHELTEELDREEERATQEERRPLVHDIRQTMIENGRALVPASELSGLSGYLQFHAGAAEDDQEEAATTENEHDKKKKSKKTTRQREMAQLHQDLQSVITDHASGAATDEEVAARAYGIRQRSATAGAPEASSVVHIPLYDGPTRDKAISVVEEAAGSNGLTSDDMGNDIVARLVQMLKAEDELWLGTSDRSLFAEEDAKTDVLRQIVREAMAEGTFEGPAPAEIGQDTPWAEGYQVDHVKEKRHGGGEDPGNLAVIDEMHHRLKTSVMYALEGAFKGSSGLRAEQKEYQRERKNQRRRDVRKADKEGKPRPPLPPREPVPEQFDGTIELG